MSDQRDLADIAWNEGFEPHPNRQPAAVHDNRWATLASICLAAAANILALSDFRLPFLGPAMGFWLIVIHPVYLLCTTSVWGRSSVAERLGYSLAAVLLLLMLGGLGINTCLPLVGVQRPLAPFPVVVLVDFLNVSLFIFRWRYPAILAWRAELKRTKPAEGRLLAGAGLCVILAVLGANRLNNDAGDQVTVVAQAAMVATLVLLLIYHRRVRDGITCATLYLLSVALILMTSLRDWYLAGHDVEMEYRVFQLTAAHSRWSMADLRSAYNACLSITILPTEVSRLVHIDNPYVYKFFFQIIFAICPVLVYTISRRYWSASVSILAVVYFVGFPTLVNDMSFLNRQEIAFIFVCVAILAITNVEWSGRRRRLTLVVALVGIEVSHYSTMYLFLGTLVVAWAAQHAYALNPRRWRSADRGSDASEGTWAVMARTVTIGSIVAAGVIMIAWGELATQTVGSAVTDAESATSALIGHSHGVQSTDVTYGLISGKTLSPQAVLNSYRRATTLRQGAHSSVGEHVSTSVASRYSTPVVDEPSLPLTGVGRVLSDAGLPVPMLNSVVRLAAAKGEQLFMGIGLITIFLMRTLRRRVGREFFCLCIGSIAMVALVTVFPDISVDYGVLRAFQEALILIAPLLVVGSLTIFLPLGQVWAPRVAAVICMGLFFSTIGLMPQLLGGYQAQLNLNNSGSYYDLYYTHPQEVQAVSWLAGKPGVLPYGVEADTEQNRFAFTSQRDVNGQQVVGDFYPTLVQKSSWVIAGYTTVHTGRATADYDGDLITYVYPLGFLRSSKNLVFNDGGAEIYK